MVSGEDVECTGPRLQVHGNSGLKCDSKHRVRDALRDHENSTPSQYQYFFDVPNYAFLWRRVLQSLQPSCLKQAAEVTGKLRCAQTSPHPSMKGAHSHNTADQSHNVLQLFVAQKRATQ